MQDVKDGENAGTGKPVQEYFFPERENRALPRTDGSTLFSKCPGIFKPRAGSDARYFCMASRIAARRSGNSSK